MTSQTANSDQCAWCKQPRARHGEGENWFGHVFQTELIPANSDQSGEGTWYGFVNRFNQPTIAEKGRAKGVYQQGEDGEVARCSFVSDMEAIIADHNAVSTLRERCNEGHGDSYRIGCVGCYNKLVTERDNLAEQKRLAVEALTKAGRCSRCQGDGSPQCVSCDDYQACRCRPGEGKYADKCWACKGTGIMNSVCREALASITALDEAPPQALPEPTA